MDEDDRPLRLPLDADHLRGHVDDGLQQLEDGHERGVRGSLAERAAHEDAAVDGEGELRAEVGWQVAQQVHVVHRLGRRVLVDEVVQQFDPQVDRDGAHDEVLLNGLQLAAREGGARVHGGESGGERSDDDGVEEDADEEAERGDVDLDLGLRLDVSRHEARRHAGAPEEGVRVLAREPLPQELLRRPPRVGRHAGLGLDRRDEPPGAAHPVARERAQHGELDDADDGRVELDDQLEVLQVLGHLAQPQQPRQLGHPKHAQLPVEPRVFGVVVSKRREHKVEREGANQVDCEGALHVMDRRELAIVDEPPLDQVARAEVDDNVDQEEDVDAKVEDRPRRPAVDHVLELGVERDLQRHGDRAVDDQQRHHRVPHGASGALRVEHHRLPPAAQPLTIGERLELCRLLLHRAE
mmetsp:Transcript_37780/g.110686  ORF Transcript_37780/g.110686 Transcript_37780/m.110686 type:complete len:410 (+) Transcript_37780:434-1663(+)